MGKKIYAGEDTRFVNIVEVHIQFSQEIAHWGKGFYYENPKFIEFWDKLPQLKAKTKKQSIKKNLWSVAYFIQTCIDEAEKGELESNRCRMLIMGLGNGMLISPTMHVTLVHNASKYLTTHVCGLSHLIYLCAECAKYCGGTVSVTYSNRDHYFVWNEDEAITVEAGSNIKNFKVVKPKHKTTEKPCNPEYRQKE